VFFSYAYSHDQNGMLKSAEDPSKTCFSTEDFKIMFTARVANPDPQLTSYLELHKVHRHYPDFQELLETLYHTEKSIYDDFTLPVDMAPAGYNGRTTQTTVAHLQELHKGPIKFMVEVGSFVGRSAARFGRLVNEHGGALFCIDTWNGDMNMVLLERFDGIMARTPQGESRIYARFLQTIKDAGLVTTVLPIRLSSITVARLVHTLQYIVDVIYLDSAHEYGETYIELILYWELLKPGGVIFGDDYDFFPAVKHDVDLFSHKIGIKPEFPAAEPWTWFLKKPEQ